MNGTILSYGLPGIVVSALVTALAKVYTDNRTLTNKLEQVAQARVDDLKELNGARDGKDAEMSQMIKLIYDKLERGKQ